MSYEHDITYAPSIKITETQEKDQEKKMVIGTEVVSIKGDEDFNVKPESRFQ